MKTYYDFIKDTRRLVESAKKIATGKGAAFGGAKLADMKNVLRADNAQKKELAAKLKKIGLTPRAVIFAPHPDDECMMSLPLRAMNECGFEIVDAAVTLGSNKQRQQPRKRELREAMEYLGWKMNVFGFEHINPQTRKADKKFWGECVGKIAAFILEKKPAVIFTPHRRDWNKTHIGTSLLVWDALALVGDKWSGVVVETELWQAMETPNMLSEVSPEILAAMTGALSCHTKEVERNPYHLNLVSYMTDNVRRGAELVGGQGGGAPNFAFGQIYRVLVKKGKGWRSAFKSLILPADKSVAEILEKLLWK